LTYACFAAVFVSEETGLAEVLGDDDVASWLQALGTSAPSILNTIDPSGFVIVLDRRS